MKKGKILSYDEMLEARPDRTIVDASLIFEEATPEASRTARERKRAMTGHMVKFFQDNGLVKRTICADAPNIPDDLKVYLRDVTPEGLEFYRKGYVKWLARFDRSAGYADPSDVRVMEKALAEMRSKNQS